MFLVSCVNDAARRKWGRRRKVGALRVPAASIALMLPLLADSSWKAIAEPVPQFPRGLPAQVRPVYMEPGLPEFSFPSGGGGQGTGSGGSGSGSSDTTSGDLGGVGRNRLLANEWGAEAIAASEELGVYGTALGATCVLEGCKNVPPKEGGTISGWYQMRDDTFLESVKSAVKDTPSLSSKVVSGLAGKGDPVTQSIAAAEYLKQGAKSLQRAHVANPTVLDTRSYYQFGPRYGAAVATANESRNMREVLAGTSEATFNANRISSTMTVGEWRQTIVKKIGSSAYQTVLR
jgi:hypothetical protein